MITPLRTRTRTALVGTLVLAAAVAPVAAAPESASAAAPAPQCQTVTALTNGGFEQPVIASNSYSIIPAASVPGWEATDPGGIEIWSTGFLGVPSAVGNQFAELNAYEAGTLFQEVTTMPGQSLQWSLLHRARVGTDVMDVLIGAPGGSLVSQGDLTDTTSGWGRHTGVYVVPAGQTVTRFGFRAVSTGSGDASIGNFLDDISFGTGPCLITTSSVTNISNPGGVTRVGDVVEYTIVSENQGGFPAEATELSDTVPAGVEFVPASIRIASGPSTGGKSDAVADDQAEYDAASRTVVARLGSGATAATGGSLASGQSTSLVFRGVVTAAAASGSIVNEPTVSYTDPLSGTRTASVAPTVVTPVIAASDLSVSQIADTPAPVAGSSTSARFTVTVANLGPQTNSGIIARITPPATLLSPSVSIGGVACSITAGVAECPIGALAVGETRVIDVSGVVDGATPAGSVLENIAAVTGTVYDPQPGNDSSSASAVTATDSDLWVTNAPRAGSLRVGDDGVFDVIVGNEGPSTATNIVMQLDLPAGTTLVHSVGSWDAALSQWTIPTLAAGATERVSLTSTTASAGRMSSRATILSSSVADRDPANGVAGAFITYEEYAQLITPTGPAPVVPAPSGSSAVPPSLTTLAFPPATSALARTGGTSDAAGTTLLAGLLLLAGLVVTIGRRRAQRR